MAPRQKKYIDVDETSVEIKFSSNSNYRKPEIGLLRPAGGKLGKPKHNFKVHLFGGISRQDLTPLIIFTGTMFSGDFQNFLTASILPFIRLKFPYDHRFSWTIILKTLAIHLDVLLS